MADVIGLSPQTFDRILKAVQIVETKNSAINQKRTSISQAGIYAKVTDRVQTNDEDPPEYKRAKAVEVVWDEEAFDWRELNEEEGEPYVYDNDILDSADYTLFTRTEIISKSEIVEGEVYLLQYYPNLTEECEWLVVETGGASARAYVSITEVTDPSNYVGDILAGPDDATVVASGVSIKVAGAQSNEYEVGYSAFADAVDGIYYIDGYLLG